MNSQMRFSRSGERKVVTNKKAKEIISNAYMFLEQNFQLKHRILEPVHRQKSIPAHNHFFDYEAFWKDEIYDLIVCRDDVANLNFFANLSKILQLKTSQDFFQRLFDMDVKYLKKGENLNDFLLRHIDPKNLLFVFYFDKNLVEENNKLYMNAIEGFLKYLSHMKVLYEDSSKEVIGVLVNYDKHMYLANEKFFFKKCIYIEQAFKKEPNKVDYDSLNELNFSSQYRIAINDIDLNTDREVLDLSDNCLVFLNELHLNLSQLLSTYLLELNLSKNSLVYLNSSTFSRLCSLKALNLSCNNLNDLPDNLFSNLVHLEELNLSVNLLGNRLKSVLFRGLKNLKCLNLNSNQLSTLDSEIFSGLYNLLFLDLGNNKLSSVSTSLFMNLTKLAILNLGFNKLTDFKEDNRYVFSSMKMLAVLCLNNNLIHNFVDGLFDDLVNLRVLTLHLNYFLSFRSNEKSLFTNLRNLRVLTIFNQGFNESKGLAKNLDIYKSCKKLKLFIRKYDFSKKKLKQYILESDTFDSKSKALLDIMFDQNLNETIN
jgi:Leucine-rich repeat (LRR) protein